MNLYIKEWSDGTAILVSERGKVLSIFSDLAEAKSICQVWQLNDQINSDTSEQKQAAVNIYTQ